MENYLIYVATIYIFARAILDLHQIKFIDNYKITRDESKILELNIKEYDRYCEYNKEKLYLSLVRLSIEAIIIYFIILFDGIVWIVNVICC